MRTQALLFCLITTMLLAGSSGAGTSAEETVVRVGTFDSRGVALAYGRSPRPIQTPIPTRHGGTMKAGAWRDCSTSSASSQRIIVFNTGSFSLPSVEYAATPPTATSLAFPRSFAASRSAASLEK